MLFSMDVKLYATAYVRAENAEAAIAIINANFGANVIGDLPTGEGDVEVYGGRFDADMPDITISPAVTFYGPDEDAVPEEHDEEEDDDACRTEECDGDPNDGEGYDGYCGNCADRQEG
jgi:hypothetical protein